MFPMREKGPRSSPMSAAAPPVKLLTRVEKLKLLTKAEKAGLLSTAEKFWFSLSSMVQSRGIGRRLGRSRDVTVAVYRSRIGRYAK